MQASTSRVSIRRVRLARRRAGPSRRFAADLVLIADTRPARCCSPSSTLVLELAAAAIARRTLAAPRATRASRRRPRPHPRGRVAAPPPASSSRVRTVASDQVGAGAPPRAS
jgi:hypothetical protein